MGMRFLDVSTDHPPEPRFMRLVGPVGHKTLHGRLGRDVYIVYDAADPTGSHASLVGRHRTHTAQQTLCALEGDPRLWKSLIVYAERRSRDVFALKVARDLGAGSDDRSSREAFAKHQRQTTAFTCGPVALLDALRLAGQPVRRTRHEEIAIWREATLGMACDPYGLALAAARRGAVPHIRVSRTGPVLDPDGGSGIPDGRLARDVQTKFEADAHRRGCLVSVRRFSARDVADIVSRGFVVMVLIDEFAMHGVVCPHWITVVEYDPSTRTLVIDDPWVDESAGETAVDVYRLPIRVEDFDLMIHYDHPRSAQALLAFTPGR